ncbi:MAG: hypothetical protein NUW24_06555 [Anaerolineae bacterium]|jgi:hypothetical protein|nr:hypothetical protein [Anaerolineae bacterium]MDH7472776.1 hypothetical protein [Anaerolineae bacterium]
MGNRFRYLLWGLAALLMLLPALVLAQSSGGTAGASSAATGAGAGYELTWWTMDGGGYTFSTGGPYSLGGTVGQPDAGVLAGGGYTLGGGFWGGGVAAGQHAIYLPLVLKNY